MGRVSDAKQRLLDATIDLIWQHSYGAVTVDNICERAGVKKGSFYYFFPSKTDLVIAALDAHWLTVKAQLDRIFDTAVPPLDRLRNYFEFVYQRQIALKEKTGRVLGCPYCSVGSETSNSDEAICSKVQELMANYAKYMESAIRDLQDAGLAKRHDVAEQTRGLFAYMHGVLGQARIQNDPEIIRGLEPGALRFLGVEPVVV
jgi:TetR/AcrR family transcriptional regulator, transcriptional repressor for nem operon